MTTKHTVGPLRVTMASTCSGAWPVIIEDCIDPDTGEAWEREVGKTETSHVETAAARESEEIPGNYNEKPHRFELKPDGEESISNAVLWAAAPQLLDALKGCMQWMEKVRQSGDYGTWVWTEGGFYIDGLNAIAKATGKPA